ncbi:MAG TPA: hypothetical protein VFE05_21680 [Longimicrobiaceae bacterium]|jgi:hypothetical protein|nr:hypothetical protein [Longimicrobiaceae bacterium]
MEDARSSLLESAANAATAELSDDDLDEVAGGLARAWLGGASAEAARV